MIGRTRKELKQAEMNSPTSDIIANIVEVQPKTPKFKRRPFSSQYREKVFYIWYNRGKPGAKSLLQFIPSDLDEWGRVPTGAALVQWIQDEYKPRADLLDQQVKDQLDAMVIQEKVEMMKRHASVAVKMQEMAIRFLNENEDVMSAPAAVRLLVEGIRIERESRGIPEALDKMQRMSDEELLEQVKEIMTNSSVSLEDLDADSRQA